MRKTVTRKVTMNRLNALLAISVAILLTFPVFQVRGLMPDFTIAHEPYQWDKDMKRLKITTPERGLTFKITISNEDTSEPISIENMRVNAKAYYGTEEYQKFFKQVSIDFIYLPPNEVFVLFVPVDFGHGDIVGDYRAEVTYDFGYGTPQKIEPFPFEFRVLSEEIFH